MVTLTPAMYGPFEEKLLREAATACLQPLSPVHQRRQRHGQNIALALTPSSPHSAAMA